MNDLPNQSPTAELLVRFRRTRDEAAFRGLVERHAGMVMATALRRTGGDAALAEDIAQEVFIQLAQKAPVIRDAAALPGWLHRAACGRSIDAVRSETRRRLREQLATDMNQRTDTDDAHAWSDIAPLIDRAINELPADDRQLVVLHYLQGSSQREAGAVLGLTEDAARKRLCRALEKMRAALVRRGVTGAAAALGPALTFHAGPVTLTVAATTRLARTALAAPALSGLALLWLQFQSLVAMTTKTKLTIAVTVALLASVPCAWLYLENRALRDRLSAMETGTVARPWPAAPSAASRRAVPGGPPAAPAAVAATTTVDLSLSQETIDAIDLPVLASLEILTLSDGACQLLRVAPAEADRVNAALRACDAAIKKLDTAHLRKIRDKPNGVVFEIPSYADGRPLRDAMIAEIDSAIGSQRAAWLLPKLAYATDWRLGRFGALSRQYDVTFDNVESTAADGEKSTHECCVVDVKWKWPDGPEGDAAAAAENPMLAGLAQRTKGSLHRIYNDIQELNLTGDHGADHCLGHLFRIEDVRP